jgi:hypothetical protein
VQAMTHACDYCQGGKARRALQRLFTRLPNLTSTKAARMADVNRPYVSSVRKEMEQRGCVPKRTVDGRRQGFVERALAQAVTTGGRPIGHTPAFDFEAVVQHFGLMTVINSPPWSSGPHSPTGGACYPGMRRAA